MAAIETARFEQVEVTSPADLRGWLASHARREGVWLVRYRRSVPDRYLSRLDLLDELPFFGWNERNCA